MKNLILILIVCLSVCFLANCGRSSKDAELIGQVKKVKPNTPLLCPDYTTADVSLGVMNGGTGSLSTQDVWVTVPPELVERFKAANKSGEIVIVNYDTWRITPCSEDNWATNINKNN